MYSPIDYPKKITEKWLKKAFAPLSDYLESHYPEEKSKMLSYVEFMTCENQRYYYRNWYTKGSIVFDLTGQVVVCDKDALRCDFQLPEHVPIQRPPKEERFVHPNVTRWVESKLNPRQEKQFGEWVRIFLQEYWGPIVNFHMEDLTIGYPLKRGTFPGCLYVYPSEFRSLMVFQFVGDEIVEMKSGLEEYRKFQDRERDLTVNGWHAVTIYPEVLDRDADLFRDYLQKATQLALPRC